MVTPIKRGTARRLGLRPPQPRPGLLIFDEVRITEQQMQEFEARWREAYARRPARTVILHAE